ncbi:MAG: glycosyltransferase [Bacteroidia bacterium]|nr:glycosyltransferase [Bacteroidia bacterium]
MNLPLISILTPFKNTAHYLDECILSIQSQTYKNWELLIVDDGSSDNSYNKVKQYAKGDSRIKLFKNHGKGIINALKLAYSHVNGEFITRMDSDDVMAELKLETMINLLQIYGKGHVAIGMVAYFSNQGISDGYYNYEQWLNNLTANGTNYSEIYKECVIPSPCWMTYKSDLENCEAFYPDRYPEDYDLTFRFYKHGLKCIPCEEVLHYWRDYNTRTSRTHEHYAQNYFLDIKLHYFLELDYDSTRSLVIWGAGFKGKTIAKNLTEKKIPFYWICDNPNKIKKEIYGTELKPFQYLEDIENPQSIITVANSKAQEEIKSFLTKQNMKAMLDYFFFC